ncbi:MAG: hypothetical protein WDZ49_07830 [Litorilinea sp.]
MTGEPQPSRETRVSDGAHATVLPPRVIETAQALARRRLGRVALLFLVAHQPLAFLAGTCLHLLSPVYRVLMASAGPERVLDEWAELFSSPAALQALAPLLLTDEPPRRS